MLQETALPNIKSGESVNQTEFSVPTGRLYRDG